MTSTVATFIQTLRNQGVQPFLGAGRNSSGRVPACFAYHDGTNAASATTATPPGLSHQSTGNYVAVGLPAEKAAGSDTDGMHSLTSSPSIFTIRNAGWWQLAAHAVFAGNATGIRALKFTVTPADGSGAYSYGEDIRPNQGAGQTVTMVCAPPAIPLLVGDTVQLLAFQSSGGNLSLSQASPSTPSMGAIRVGNL